VSNDVQYAIVLSGINSALLAQERAITIHRSNNAQPVATVALGYAGDSPGAGMVDITVENALPQEGLEFDAGPVMAAVGTVEFYVYLPGAPPQLKCTAFVYEDTLRHGVNTPASYSFRCRAPLEQWEPSATGTG
jgi:hypothetical protein